jgi:hypothetical protein
MLPVGRTLPRRLRCNERQLSVSCLPCRQRGGKAGGEIGVNRTWYSAVRKTAPDPERDWRFRRMLQASVYSRLEDASLTAFGAHCLGDAFPPRCKHEQRPNPLITHLRIQERPRVTRGQHRALRATFPVVPQHF